jgi:hypothetical protein
MCTGYHTTPAHMEAEEDLAEAYEALKRFCAAVDTFELRYEFDPEEGVVLDEQSANVLYLLNVINAFIARGCAVFGGALNAA